MAHGTEKRTQLRGLYVYKRLPMDAACSAMRPSLPKSTGNRWKADARAAGDDWDSARAAVALGDENFAQLGKKLLEDYLVMHQAVVDEIKADKAMKATEKVAALASLTDSFNKTMSALRKVAPELNRHAIALDALQRLAAFAEQNYPKNVPALIEMLEPFGAELAKAYG
jgi:hypothetical protein